MVLSELSQYPEKAVETIPMRIILDLDVKAQFF
jgi:hypothetical protein